MSLDPTPQNIPDSTASNQAHWVTPPGDSRLDIRVELPPEAEVTVALDVRAPDGSLLDQRSIKFSNPAALTPASLAVRGRAALEKSSLGLQSLAAWLTGAALLIYLITRLVGLSDFPMYFFTDEAIQTNLAADLVRDGFRSYTDELLPTFFENGNQFNLSTSVYLQVLPYVLFGKAIWVTRGAAVLVTLLAALAVGRILRDVYNSPHPWSAVLLLSVTPAWFLHSRTAFETALAVTFYAVFLYCYLIYRSGKTSYLYGAIIAGALAFYTYSPAQMVMLVSALLMLISDARYHWQQRGVVLRGLGLAVLLALPYGRFLLNHPGENLRHMQILNSYWVKDIPLGEKLAIFGSEYLRGLDPRYWFLPNDVDFSRHVMKEYGHLPRWGLPLVAIGLFVALKGFRNPANRVLLIALLAAPSGAALAALGVTRALFMVIPAALLAAIGLSALLIWLDGRLAASRWRLDGRFAALTVFALLAVWNVGMLTDALNNGPTWFADYGLGGMQYGAKQLQVEINDHLTAHPLDRVVVSPSWTNGTNDVLRFFFADEQPVDLGGIDSYLGQRLELDEHTLFVLLPDELDRAARSGKFEQVRLERMIFYPDGNPGFYFVRLAYSPRFEAILATESEQRRALQQERITWDNQAVDVRFSVLDMGQIQDGFDGEDLSILRSYDANPLILDIRPAEPRAITYLGVLVGGTPTRVTMRIEITGQSQPLVLAQTVLESPDPRYVNFTLPRAVTAERIRLEVLTTNEAPPAHVHLWEVRAR